MGVVVDGAEQDVPLERDDARGLMRLHVRACAQQRLEPPSVDVSLRLRREPVTRAGEEYLPGSVVLRRRAGSTDKLTVLDLAGSVLLKLSRGGDVRAPGTPSVRRTTCCGCRCSSARCAAATPMRSAEAQTFLFEHRAKSADASASGWGNTRPADEERR